MFDILGEIKDGVCFFLPNRDERFRKLLGVSWVLSGDAGDWWSVTSRASSTELAKLGVFEDVTGLGAGGRPPAASPGAGGKFPTVGSELTSRNATAGSCFVSLRTSFRNAIAVVPVESAPPETRQAALAR